MNTIDFVKMVASGNDFVVVDNTSGNLNLAWQDFAKKACDRRYGIGADGVLLLVLSKKADIRMRIFNPDGSEADMCGNGARCCARYFDFYLAAIKAKPVRIETKAGILDASVSDDKVRLRMSDPRDVKLNLKINLHNSDFTVHHINTGVPHTIVFVKDFDKTDVAGFGSQIRYHKEFSPSGTNADFVKVQGKNSIAIRTYERGVEAETLACGTGCVASAIIYVLEVDGQKSGFYKVDVLTKSGEVLKISFDKKAQNFSNVFLEGSAKIVYSGRFGYGS